MNARTECVDTTAAWLIGLAGGVLAWAGWFAPHTCAPLAALVCAGCFLWRGTNGAGAGAAVGIASGVTAILCAKDLLTAGPLGRAAVELGVASGLTARQPDAAAACSAAATAGIIVVVFQILRAALEDPRAARAWSRAAVVVATGTAAAALTASRAYGDGFQVGEVASRNAAAGAFALATMVAAGLALDAVKAGRVREWPAAAAAGGVCAAAAASLGSRGGLVALLAGAIYFVARAGGRRARGWVLPTGALLIGALLVAPGTVARLGDLGDEYRLELWWGSLRAWVEAPLGGVGGGGFADAFALFSGMLPVEGARVTHPDSSWVLLLVEWGAAGVVLVALAGWRLLRGGGRGGAPHGLGIGAEAGLVVWAVAAMGDVAFHRAASLAIGVPLLAIAWPVGAGDGRTQGRGWTRAIGAALAFALAGMAAWEGAGPLDRRVNHEKGFAALGDGDAPAAAGYFVAAAATDPANTEALRLYARALMPTAPELALPLWRRLFLAAGPRASFFLGEELARGGGVSLRYWMRAAETRPEAWVLLADRDEDGAQGCFERWRTASEAAKRLSPQQATLGALARWGVVADLTAWMETRPPIAVIDGVNGARFLSARGRGDMAWAWLAGVLPEPEDLGRAEPDEGLRARVLANPEDHVAAARLLAQTESSEERVRLLSRWSERADAPPWFRIRLAHTLARAGRRDEALAMLLEAVEATRRTRAAGAE